MTEPVRVEGLAALVKALRAASGDLVDLKTANKAVGETVLGGARTFAPRRTGRLAASGRASRAAKKASVIFGKASVPYARPVHWGWPARGIEPHPFVLQGAARTETEWVAAYSLDIQRILDSI